MKTFTINADHNISAFATQEEAAATFDSFASQKELAELAAAWPPERLVAIWNSLPGVKPVKSFKNTKASAGPGCQAARYQSARNLPELSLGRAWR